MKFSIMTSPHYYDVTHFLTDSNENWTAYVKLNPKIFLFVELFWFFGILIEKITIYYENPVYCTVTLHLSPSPLGRPLGWVLLGTHLSHTWGYFLNTKKIFFTKSGENKGWSLLSPSLWPPIWGASTCSTRSSLIVWDTFPPYLRMPFQQKTFFVIFDFNLGW